MKKDDDLHITYLPFDHAMLITKPKLLEELATFYCSIWMKDPNFGEYNVCPTCGKYYSEVQVVLGGITQCNGNENPHPTIDLVPAWEPNAVADEELLGNTSKYGDNFYGLYAIDSDTDRIVGFTWGWLERAETIRDKWGQPIVEKLGNNDATYYSEIAVDPCEKYRGKRIGKTLCGLLTMWMSTAHPNEPSFLRTHKASFAKNMFQKAGYRYFAEDPQHGDGRIMMMVKKGTSLVP